MLDKIIISILIIYYIFKFKNNKIEKFENDDSNDDSSDDSNDNSNDDIDEDKTPDNINTNIKVNLLLYKSPNNLHILQNKLYYNNNSYKDKNIKVIDKINKIYQSDVFELNNIENVYGNKYTENLLLNDTYGIKNKYKIKDFIVNHKLDESKFLENIDNYKDITKHYKLFLNKLIKNSKIGKNKLSWNEYNNKNSNYKYINIIVFGDYNKIINKDSEYTYEKNSEKEDLLNPKSIFVTSYKPNHLSIAHNLGLSFGLTIKDCLDTDEFLMCNNISKNNINLSDDELSIINKIITSKHIKYPFPYKSSKHIIY